MDAPEDAGITLVQREDTMKKDLIQMFPIDPCQSPLDPPPFVLGKRCFAPARPGNESHLYLSRVEGYRLLYQLMGSRGLLSPAVPFAPSFEERFRRKEPQLHRLLLSISNPEGRRVCVAQVVFTLIGADGSQRMIQGFPCAEGHGLIFEWDTPEALRIETEVIANGRLLTDHFVLEIKQLLN
jgi:hypothetical protein